MARTRAPLSLLIFGAFAALGVLARPGLGEGGTPFLCASVLLGAALGAYLSRSTVPPITGAAPRPREAAIAFLLFLLGLGMHLYRLDSPLAFDEYWMWDAQVKHPLLKNIAAFESDNNHPLYSTLAWISARVIGDGRFAIRLPAAVFGALDIAAVFWLGRRFLSRGEALFAALLTAFSYHHLWFAQNARGYTALFFFTLASSDLVIAMLERGRKRDVIAYGIAAGLGTWAHLTGVYVVMAHALIAAVRLIRPVAERPRFAALHGIVAAGLCSLFLHAPLLLQMLRFFTTKRAYFEEKPVWRSPLWTIEAALRSFGLPLWAAAIVFGLAAIVMILGILRLRKTAPVVVFLAFLPAVLGGGALIAMGRNLWPRFFFFLGGLFALIVVAGIDRVLDRIGARTAGGGRPRWVTAAAVAVLCGSLVFASRAWRQPKQDFEGARAFIAVERRPGQRVFAPALAGFVYRSAFGEDYEDLQSADDLVRALGPTPPLLVFVSDIHLKGWNPKLWDAIRAHATQLRAFAGTMGQDPVVVVLLDR